MTETARVFIAVNIPNLRPLQSVVRELSLMGRAVKPVAGARLHLTLRFLGDVEREVIPIVAETLVSAVQNHPPFTLGVVGLGAFPHTRRPSVVWAGLEDAQPLIEIARNLESELQSLGFTADPKPFHPHVTLARVRSRPPEDLATLFSEHESTEFGKLTVEDIRLFESELRAEGPRYTVLHVANLRED